MVAAAKLRRAQSAAEAARPYAERMEAVLANLATALQGREGGSPLMVGTGKDNVHLLVVATAERGLCGAFNSSIVRLARDHAYRLMNDGKQVKILLRRQEGLRSAEAPVRLADHRGDRAQGREAARLQGCREDRAENSEPVRRRAIRRGDAVLLALPLGDQPDPDGLADHPGADPARPPRRKPRSAARSMNTSPTRPTSSPTSCPSTSPRRSSARCSRTRPRSRARA